MKYRIRIEFIAIEDDIMDKFDVISQDFKEDYSADFKIDMYSPASFLLVEMNSHHDAFLVLLHFTGAKILVDDARIGDIINKE